MNNSRHKKGGNKNIKFKVTPRLFRDLSHLKCKKKKRSSNKQEQATTCITNIQTQNTFANLEMQEQQEDTQTGKGNSSQAAEEADQ